MSDVINYSGRIVDFSTAVQMMDDDIRERVHDEFAPCSDQTFFTEYEKAHEAKHGGEQWEMSKINPVW